MGRTGNHDRRRGTRPVLLGLVLVLVLLPGFLLTGLRLTQLDAGWAIRAVAFAPVAAPLYIVGLLVLLGLSVSAARSRDGRRAARRLLAALGISALLFLHLSWLAPSYSGELPQPAEGGPRLRVLTANVLHGATTPADVATQAARAEADVVVLQEVTAPWWGRARSADLGRRFPHAAGQPKSAAGGADPGTLVLARRPLGRARELSTVGDSFVVAVHLGERTVDLLAAHPRYPVRSQAWRSDHEVLAQAVKEIRPALVVGDFNATFDHAQMQRYRDLGYRSADELLNSGWSPTWPDHGTRSLWVVDLPRLVQIDHVLVWRSLTATEVEHLELPGSDHRAVVAEVAPR